MKKQQGQRILALVLALGLGAGLAHAATPEEAQAELARVQETLARSNARVEDITAALAAALKAQSEISDQLVKLAAQRAEQQSAIADSNQRIALLESQSVTLASDLAARQDELALLLAGLQKLQANPPPALVVEPGNVLEALRGAMMFGAVVPEISAQAQELRGKLDELQAIRAATQDERQRLEKNLSALAASEAGLAELQAQKRAFAASASQNLDTEKKTAASLADKAKTLQQLLADLEKAREDEDKRKSAEAKAAADAAARAEAERLAALEKPRLPLSSLKGKLAFPVQGTIIRQFGQDNGLGSPLEGLAFAVEPHANVTTPVDGKVEFAGPFRSYGQLLILNAGEGYLVLLAGMKQISAEMGQTLKAGEPVGVMGEGPSSLALLGDDSGNTRPVFYVEFRKDNAPVDPTPWWDNGKKEAMR